MSGDANSEERLENLADARVRSLRRGACLVGAPLALALVVPWSFAHGDSLSWNVAGRTGHWGFVLLPLCGLVMMLAAFAPRWAYRRRALVFGGAALCTPLIGVSLLGNASVLDTLRPIQHISSVGMFSLLACWVSASAFHMAMHQRPSTRGLSVLTLVGWAAVLLSTGIPLVGPFDFSGSIFGIALDAGFGPFLALMTPAWLAAIGMVEAALRIMRPADRRWRTKWLSYVLLAVPLFAGAVGALIFAYNVETALRIFNGLGFGLGILVAPTLGGAHLLTMLSFTKAESTALS